MISQIAINLEAFETHVKQQELDYLKSIDVDLHVIFLHVQDLMVQTRGLPLQMVPTQQFREAFTTSKVIVANIDFHYWNNTSPNIEATPVQYREKLLESVIHHARLLYVDLWGIVNQFGIPLQNITTISRLPYGAILHVATA